MSNHTSWQDQISDPNGLGVDHGEGENAAATHHGPWCDEDDGEACSACTEPFEVADIDLDKITAAVVAAGIPAYVEMTGGGVATIYAGERRIEHEEWQGRTLTHHRYAALGGPGWFEGPGYTVARAGRCDFYVGPDDDGDSTPWASTATTTDDEIVAKIVEVARLRP